MLFTKAFPNKNPGPLQLDQRDNSVDTLELVIQENLLVNEFYFA
jgi:hypothetical protein